MNAFTGAALEPDELPGDALIDLRFARASARTPTRRRGRLGPGEAVPFGWVLGPFLLLLFWTTGSAAGLIDPRVLPAPWTTAATAWDLVREGRLQHNLLVSALRAAQGLVWGVAAGTVVALVSGLSQPHGMALKVASNCRFCPCGQSPLGILAFAP